MYGLLGAAANGVGIENDIGLGDLLNLATSTGFAGLAWYLIVRHIPKMMTDFREDIREERRSREAATAQFMEMVTENRERSHEQRMEDRKVYLEATQTLLRESLTAMKEIKNGNA